jgi:hypothetical protein
MGFINRLIHFSGCQINISPCLQLHSFITFNGSCFGIDTPALLVNEQTNCLNYCP